MKRPVLWLVLVLVVGTAAWFGWRRTQALETPVDLTKHDGQTIDFSSGKPVVKDTSEDTAAMDAAVKDMAEATKGVTFEPVKKAPEPAAATPKS